MTAGVEPRLCIYSQDGSGLGHLRRTSLLAAEFLNARPGSSALTISDSPLGQHFTTAPGHDYLKLPSIRQEPPGGWQPAALSSAIHDVVAVRSATIRSAVLSFRPDVLLVDHLPQGAMGELLPTLQALDGVGVHVVLGLRDILDSPAVIRQRWAAEGAFAAMENHYDEVLVYGCRDVFDVAGQYGWPPAAQARLGYCGYLCSPTANPPGYLVRARFLRDTPGAQLVVAMAGGGTDGFRLFDKLLQALPAVRAERRCALVIVTGPLMPPGQRTELARRAALVGAHLLNTVGDAVNYLAAADLVVTMAGYNTTADVLSLGKSALLVPRSGPSAEQRTRARLFAQRGWVRWLPPQELSATSLAVAMLNAFDRRPRPTEQPDLGGLAAAAARLVAALDGPGRARRKARVRAVPPQRASGQARPQSPQD